MTHVQGTAEFPSFAPDAAIRRVHRDSVLLLGGGRALLLQIAHPAVARGVAEHSNFRADRFGRLLRTLRPMLAIAYGSRQQALAAAEGVNRLHESVSGKGYRALDPDLLLWVLATLIDTSLLMHERFLQPLSRREAEAYYADMRRVGALLRLSEEHLPPDYEAFRTYFDGAVESLQVSVEARKIARSLFDAGTLLAPVLSPARWVTAGLLPPSVRRQFGLRWGRWDERVLRAACATSRAVLPRLPRRVRSTPWFLMPQSEP